MLVDLVKVVKLVDMMIYESEWEVEKKTIASSGSVYYELQRFRREWVVIRVADHRQFYHKFLTTYSVDPSSDGIDLDELKDLLESSFGEAGDVLL